MNDNSPKEVFVRNMWTNNPIFIQLLGICSTLAVTNNLINTTIMTVGVALVTGFSNITVSILKDFIPRKVRMIYQTLIIATYVIIVDMILRAYAPEASKALGPYVGLIITNCIIMGRAEAFAQSNSAFISFWDGITSGLGYMSVLMVIAFIRELLGFGTFFNIEILPPPHWNIMVTAPSAFFLLGGIIWAVRSYTLKQEEKAAKAGRRK